MSTTNQPGEPSSRLDREISEILEEARRRPISFQDKVAQRRNAMQSRKATTVDRARSVGTGPIRSLSRLAMRLPLVTALVVAVIAVWLAPEYQTLATILGLVAAALIFAPFVMKRPGDDFQGPKRWRGRSIEPARPPSGIERSVRSWIDSARNRLGR
jgi:hypothetical protein